MGIPVGQLSSKRRIVSASVALAIFLVLSSFFGNYLLAADARAGGLDVEWKVPLTKGFGEVLTTPDGLLIVRESGDLLRELDRNGTVLWEYSAVSCRDLSVASDGRVYFIEERPGSNNSVVCLFSNGSMNWRFETDRVVQDFQIGADGNIYFIEDPNTESILVCLTGDGLVAWGYAPATGELTTYPFLVLPNGNVLVRETIVRWGFIGNNQAGWVSSFDHLVSLSGKGKVLWETDILALTEVLGACQGPVVRGNDTVQLTFADNDTQTEVGLDDTGSIVWRAQSVHNAFPGVAGPSDIVYYLEVYEDQPWGYPSHLVSRISSWNASLGNLNFQVVLEGEAYGPMVMGDNASLFLINGELAKIGAGGEIVWHSDPYSNIRILDDDGNCGVLLGEGSKLTMIGGDGVKRWEYRLDSKVYAGILRADGSIVVMNDEYVISIDRPVLTTTMNYFVVLLAIDLFVTLMTLVRIADMVWPTSKARME
jgi:hypothetical protein